jgi:hypothetical protein
LALFKFSLAPGAKDFVQGFSMAYGQARCLLCNTEHFFLFVYKCLLGGLGIWPKFTHRGVAPGGIKGQGPFREKGGVVISKKQKQKGGDKPTFTLMRGPFPHNNKRGVVIH